jgi:hypothetical protein
LWLRRHNKIGMCGCVIMFLSLCFWHSQTCQTQPYLCFLWLVQTFDWLKREMNLVGIMCCSRASGSWNSESSVGRQRQCCDPLAIFSDFARRNGDQEQEPDVVGSCSWNSLRLRVHDPSRQRDDWYRRTADTLGPKNETLFKWGRHGTLASALTKLNGETDETQSSSFSDETELSWLSLNHKEMPKLQNYQCNRKGEKNTAACRLNMNMWHVGPILTPFRKQATIARSATACLQTGRRGA